MSDAARQPADRLQLPRLIELTLESPALRLGLAVARVEQRVCGLVGVSREPLHDKPHDSWTPTNARVCRLPIRPTLKPRGLVLVGIEERRNTLGLG